MKKKIFKFIKAFFGVIFTLILIGLTTASICGVVFANYINLHIVPKSVVDVSDLTLNLTSKIYYEDPETGINHELESLHGEQNRILADYEEIPKQLIQAFIAIEDERFYIHEGVDWTRTIGAAINWVVPFRDGFGGGSTITQQLVKNATDDDDYKVTRKVTEVLRALKLEETMSKEEILTLYLNTIYLGRNAYGVKTAAQTYFNKELDELSLAECAIIAGITKNPSYYDPFRFPENIKTRQELILDQMSSEDIGFITKHEAEAAKLYELDYKSEENTQKLQSSQSYFVDAVVQDVLDDLMEQKGYSAQVASQLLYSGGLNIYSTIDLKVQQTLEDVYEDESNFPGIAGKDGALPQSSMVIIDPNTGQVKGLVGGRGEKTGDRILNRATQTTRSPGSAIKPIAVYAPAIDKGLITPISVIEDSPYNFTVTASGWPKNETSGFSSSMTVTTAVSRSINTVAVKVLDMLTPRESYNFMTSKLGVDLVESRTNSSGYTYTDIALAPLALGGLTDGISVLELTAAYVPFANEGVYYEPVTYTKVVDSKGQVILENPQKPTQVFEDPDTVFYMRQLLTNVVSSGTGTRAKIANMQTLGKTGTTNDDNDRWFVGATPYYVAATWFGYDVQQTIKGVYTNPALAMWEQVMDELHVGLEAKNFESASNFKQTSYCMDSGMKPSEYCSLDVRGSRVASGSIASGDGPTTTCTWHTPIQIDITTGGMANEFCPVDLVETRVLLDLTRYYGKSIYLPDEGYTFTVDNDPIGTAGVRALRTTNADGKSTYTGHVCTVHTAETALENPELDDPELDDLENEESELPYIPNPFEPENNSDMEDNGDAENLEDDEDTQSDDVVEQDNVPPLDSFEEEEAPLDQFEEDESTAGDSEREEPAIPEAYDDF